MLLGARAIRELQVGATPTQQTLAGITIFTAFQFTRLPSIGRAISTVYVEGATERMRLMFANVERARIVLEKYARETGDPVNVSPESMVEAVKRNELEITATEIPFLTNMLQQAVTLGRLIAQLNWQVVMASPETGFITCDSPVVVVPPKGSAAVGFLVPGA